MKNLKLISLLVLALPFFSVKAYSSEDQPHPASGEESSQPTQPTQPPTGSREAAPLPAIIEDEPTGEEASGEVSLAWRLPTLSLS